MLTFDCAARLPLAFAIRAIESALDFVLAKTSPLFTRLARMPLGMKNDLDLVLTNRIAI